MSTDNPVKPLSAEVIAEDLELSNAEGASWYGYQIGAEPNTILAQQYGDEGDIVATYTITISIKENN